MNFDMLPFNLHKANTELLLSILGLTRDYRCRWLEAANDYHMNAMSQSRAELAGLSQKSGAEAAFGLPVEVCARMMGSGMNGALALRTPWVETHTEFIKGLHQSFQDWQATVAGVSPGS